MTIAMLDLIRVLLLVYFRRLLMPLQRAALYLLVQFEDVVCQYKQNSLTQDILMPSRKKASISPALICAKTPSAWMLRFIRRTIPSVLLIRSRFFAHSR